MGSGETQMSAPHSGNKIIQSSYNSLDKGLEESLNEDMNVNYKIICKKSQENSRMKTVLEDCANKINQK